MNTMKEVLIFGATGNMGGAAARALLQRDWKVKAVTRDPESDAARALEGLGAEIVRADMEDRPSLEAAFEGIDKVFSVQSWTKSGIEGEIRQGKLVATVAHAAGVKHLVYGSAGTGEPGTGVQHFDSKLEVEAHMRGLNIPFTIVRPGPYMELLSEKEFFPAAGTWGTEPKVVGWHTPKPWVAVRDIGIAIANIFADPKQWIGRDVTLFGDVKSLAECRAIFTEIDGKKPLRIPLPLWLFRRLAEPEFIVMWRWLVQWFEQRGVQEMWQLRDSTRALCPDLLDMRSWLLMKRGRSHTTELILDTSAADTGTAG